MNFELEGIRVWVQVLVRGSQDDHTEVSGVVADFGYRGVDEGSIVVHVFQGYQQSPRAGGGRVTCGKREGVRM